MQAKQKLKSGQGFAGDDEGFGFEFTEEDISSIHVQHSASSLFLDRYSERDVMELMESSGISQKLRARGHTDVIVSFDLSDPFVQKMKWLSNSAVHVLGAEGRATDNEGSCLLCDCVLRVINSVSLLKAARASPSDAKEACQGASMIRDWAARVASEDPERPLRLCVVEWLLLQDPFAPPSNRRLLPGQKLPGLGVFVEFGQLLAHFAIDCDFDAVINRPLHFHNAVMYSDPNTTFLNPHMEDCFRGMCRDLLLQQKNRGVNRQYRQDCTTGKSGDKEMFPTKAAARISAVDSTLHCCGPSKTTAPGLETSDELIPFSCTSRHNAPDCVPALGLEAKAYDACDWLSLGDLSHAVNCGALKVHAEPGPITVRWSAQEQICAVSCRTRGFFGSEEYKAACMQLWKVPHAQHLLHCQTILRPQNLSHPHSMVTGITGGKEDMLAARMTDPGNGRERMGPSACEDGMDGHDPSFNEMRCNVHREESWARNAFFLDNDTEVNSVKEIEASLQLAPSWHNVSS